MKKPDLSRFIKNADTIVTKHGPAIFMGLGVAFGIASTVLAVKETPKALRLIEEKKAELELSTDESLTPMETVKTCWKCYIPAVAAGTFSVICLASSHSVHTKRNAALITAYKISETALTEYREKVVETIGEKKEQMVRDGLAKDKIEKNPVSKNQVIITGKGNTLCYDPLSGQYFHSDIDLIRKAENKLNKKMLNEEYISLNDFYDEVGLKATDLGDTLGWSIGKDGMIEIYFSSQIADDETPCIVINFEKPPRYDYSKFA